MQSCCGDELHGSSEGGLITEKFLVQWGLGRADCFPQLVKMWASLENVLHCLLDVTARAVGSLCKAILVLCLRGPQWQVRSPKIVVWPLQLRFHYNAPSCEIWTLQDKKYIHYGWNKLVNGHVNLHFNTNFRFFQYTAPLCDIWQIWTVNKCH